MTLKSALQILQLIVSVLIIVMILLQSHGTGLSSTLTSIGSFQRSRRGLEKVVFWGTIILGIVFVINSFVIVFFLV